MNKDDLESKWELINKIGQDDLESRSEFFNKIDEFFKIPFLDDGGEINSQEEVENYLRKIYSSKSSGVKTFLPNLLL